MARCRYKGQYVGETVKVDGMSHAVYGCPFHGKCLIKAERDGYSTCARCADWEATSPERRPIRKRGLGDLVGQFFESVGVTKERYKSAKQAVGLPPTCNCDARKEWLNKLGDTLGINGAADRLAGWRKERRAV